MKSLSARLRREVVNIAGCAKVGHDGLIFLFLLLALFLSSLLSVRPSLWLIWGAHRLKRGLSVTMDAQKMPRLGSITPYRALPTLSYVLSVDCVDWTTVRRRRTEMTQALFSFVSKCDTSKATTHM